MGNAAPLIAMLLTGTPGCMRAHAWCRRRKSAQPSSPVQRSGSPFRDALHPSHFACYAQRGGEQGAGQEAAAYVAGELLLASTRILHSPERHPCTASAPQSCRRRPGAGAASPGQRPPPSPALPRPRLTSSAPPCRRRRPPSLHGRPRDVVPHERWDGKPRHVKLMCGLLSSCKRSGLPPGSPCEQAQGNSPFSGCMPRRAMAGASAQNAQKGAMAAASSRNAARQPSGPATTPPKM